MPKRSSKAKDNEIAASILEAIQSGSMPKTPDGKNPFAVALGRMGGLKGGRARAAALTKTQRAEIARTAAITRWSRVSREM